MKIKLPVFILAICLSISFSGIQSQTNHLVNIKINQRKSTIKPTMWGIFFEDINLAADGGIYAELVKNRSFEFNDPFMGWDEQEKGSKGGSLLVINRGLENPNNPRFIRVKAPVSGQYGITNEGFRGMGIQQGKKYDFSVWARVPKGSASKLRIELQNAK
jgi:hypothetical protein